MNKQARKEFAQMGARARWKKVSKEERSKIMRKVSKARKLKK